MALGQRIWRIREEAGLELAEVARLSCLSIGEIEEIEQGVNADPTYSELIVLAAVLRVSFNHLFEVARWQPPTSDNPGGFVWANRPDDD